MFPSGTCFPVMVVCWPRYLTLLLLFHRISAGAVGINLTQANCVFLMEPCFNPALEAQAIGRVQRLGQTRSVEIVRLVMQDSVETRIRTMLDKKYGTEQSAKDAYSDKVKEGAEKDTDEEDERKPAAKLFVAPAITTSVASIGCIRTDKAAVMADEFDLLFGVDSVEEGEDPVPDNAQSSEGMIGFI